MTDNGFIEGGFLSNGPLYSLLAVYMPLSSLIAPVLLLETLLPVTLPLALIITTAFISAVTSSLYRDFMKNANSSLIADIRGGIIIAGVFYALASVFRMKLPFLWRFKPGLDNTAPVLASIYAWYSVIPLKQLFSARRHFEIYTELYNEAQLQNVLREDSYLLNYTDEIISKRKRYYITQLAVIGILTLFCELMKVPLPLYLYLLLVAILAVGIYICGFFEIMRWEQYYAGEGIAISAADRLKRTGGMWALILLCAVCAVLAASDKSLLPFSAIAFLFAWIFSLIRGLLHPITKAGKSESLNNIMDKNPLYDFQNESAPGWFSNWMSEYGVIILKYSLIILVIAAFIIFMIYPLIKQDKSSDRKLKFHERLWRTIAEWFRGLLTGIASFFALLKNDNDKDRQKLKTNSGEIRRTAEAVMNVYSRAKRQDMKRSVTLFARLIIWGGETGGLTWKPSYAPGEYCDILAASVKHAPDNAHNGSLKSGSFPNHLNEGIIRCGELFEKALYSAEILSSAEQQEFKNTVDKITGTVL
jgi:hypothetical protein